MKKIFVLAIISLSLNLQALSADFNNVKFIKNHDGDTMNFDLGASLPDIFRFISVRLYGIDTPEVSTKNLAEKSRGLMVRDFVYNSLSQAKNINLVNCKDDKYFRLNCFVIYDNKNLTSELLNRSYGYAYYGGKKQKINY